MGLKSSAEILVVSGRAAGDILLVKGSEGAEVVNLVDELGRGGHEVNAPSPEIVDVRDIAFRSPITYSREKVEQLGSFFMSDLEAEGLGDMDVSGSIKAGKASS